MQRIPLSSLLWVLAVLAAGALLVFVMLRPAPPPVSQGADHERLPVADAVSGGPIELPVSTTGERFRLADLEGRYVWVYFGYTACPDACPTSLGWISAALDRLPPELEGEVAAVLVSVDPERDDRERLETYVGHFHPAIQAATGSHEELQPITERYGVFYERTEIDSAMGYVVDHSSSTYLVGPEGDLLQIYPHGTPAAELVEGLRTHAEATGTAN
ncbi:MULTISPECIES: SCO family protein [unclassified Thioalkalivibrio]|uniref:SCO family protein n=1 Tax=unclassified Thioalkalivibrio TaxID=2621013 RepID=UPI000382C28B|nr:MULTISPECIES: SCO family protein [unclassified Thioalkalivibrio]